jgi:hypothetical protein
MANDSIDRILEQRRLAEQKQQPAATEGDKFFSILLGEGLQEHFLELQFRSGLRTCFSYTDLLWFNFDPESGCIDLEFGGFLITITGRGFAPELFNGLKNKRVAWVKEADSEMQDNEANAAYISQITITPPKGFTEEEPAAEQ